MKNHLALSVVLILAIFFASCNGAKSVQENESIAKAFIEAWNSHDMNKLNSLFADEFVYHEVASGRSYSTKEALSNYGNLTIAGIPDTKLVE